MLDLPILAFASHAGSVKLVNSVVSSPFDNVGSIAVDKGRGEMYQLSVATVLLCNKPP